MVEKIINSAKSFIGTVERDEKHKEIIRGYNNMQAFLPRGYKMTLSDDWCAAFVTFIFAKNNMLFLITPECSCTRMLQGMDKNFRFINNGNYKPKKGDIVFYDWSGKKNKNDADHVGIVIDTDGYNITVVEGNYNDKVATRKISIKSNLIIGYGLPNYAKNKKSNEAIAKEVIQGKWGNGTERKKKIENAGYNYEIIQYLVNTYYNSLNSKPKDYEKVAREVIQGKWGNGTERKEKLTKAGYDYFKVQEIVNKIL